MRRDGETGTAGFPDHFSWRAAAYARFRPRYPAALFDWIVEQAPGCRVAWDCATGSGQAALALAERVPLVVATDASTAQLREAAPHPRVRYLACTAERAALRAGSVDVATVAQAMHWFDAEAFAGEVRRVLAPRGLVVVWNYGDPTLGDVLDAAAAPVLDRARAWWPAERAHVVEGYRNLPFPFRELAPPTLWLEQDWTLAQLLGYVGTWSVRKPYDEATRGDLVAELREALAPGWDAAATRRVRWPLAIRAGRTE